MGKKSGYFIPSREFILQNIVLGFLKRKLDLYLKQEQPKRASANQTSEFEQLEL